VPVRQTDCNFCSKGHYIHDCDLVNNYAHAGKCKCNNEGKVVLPTGAFIPRDIPGTLLQERFDEWHRRNPNQLAAPSSTMMHTIIDPPGSTSSYAHTHETYQLSATDRICVARSRAFRLKGSLTRIHSNDPYLQTEEGSQYFDRNRGRRN
jgi:hypothetical protein